MNPLEKEFFVKNFSSGFNMLDVSYKGCSIRYIDSES